MILATKPKSKPRRKDVPQPKTAPDERSTLLGFLDYLRDRVIAKVEGVPEPDARRPGVDSGTNLLGLVKHLGFVERNQFLHEKPASWPKTFTANDDETVEGLIADYRESIRLSNEAIAASEDLGSPVTGKSGPPLRWHLVHAIEETGRHAGQMDIIRERIDGATGR